MRIFSSADVIRTPFPRPAPFFFLHFSFFILLSSGFTSIHEKTADEKQNPAHSRPLPMLQFTAPQKDGPASCNMLRDA